MINAILPEELRDYERVLDKKGVSELLESVEQHGDSDLYRRVVQGLHQIGFSAAQTSGASSFGIRDLRTPKATKRMVEGLRARVQSITDREDIPDDKKDEMVQGLIMSSMDKVQRRMMEEAQLDGNPFSTQVISGSRGGEADLRSLIVGDMLVSDHKDRVIPVPLLNSYASGVSPAEYWAGSYGARKGTVSTKLATARAGFFGKQLTQAAHRLVVTTHDCETDRGIPVLASDPDNEGAVLAAAVGGVKAGTVLDPRNTEGLGDDEVFVRSPITCEAAEGICARCAGIRERGDFPEIGDNVGVAAAQALSEPVSQGALNVKHKGGRVSGNERERISGFDLINQTVQVPKAFRDAAAVSKIDGIIQEVKDAPQGGKLVMVNDIEHYVPQGFDVTVKPGQRVEAGDLMSDGIPNPAEIVKHKGIGAGRVHFMNNYMNAYKSSGLRANRRNVELVTRGLVNHVRVTDLDGVDDALPDDIVPYSAIERKYRPRYGFRVSSPESAINSYLERPVRQYSIGTRVTPAVAEDLRKAKIKEVYAHNDPPPFEPQMVRAMENMAKDPDWQVRLGGSYLQKGLLESVHRGGKSKEHGVSFFPGVARGKGLGEGLSEEGTY
jgi:DNA-directed RNA polymerase subunit beta'